MAERSRAPTGHDADVLDALLPWAMTVLWTASLKYLNGDDSTPSVGRHTMKQ